MMTWEKLLFNLLVQIMPGISAQLHEALDKFVRDLDHQAQKTDNNWDNLLVTVLAGIFDIKL